MKKVLLALAILAMMWGRASAAQYYWDSDLTATSNNATTGDSLGGSGDWDNLTTSNWWDGVSGTDSQWDDSAGSGAIFWGIPGTVTLGSPRSATSLAFKTDSYTVTGSTLNLSAPATITVDSGLSASVSSVLAGSNGYSVSGGGTLNLDGVAANTNTGAVSVSGGSILAITASDRIGGATGDITLNNGTMRSNDPTNIANLFLPASRNIIVGPSGGTIDVAGTTPAILTYGGTISGVGNTLTKAGTGEIRMNGSTDFTFQKLVITGGYSLGQAGANGRDGQLGAVPGSFMQDQVTLDGGQLRFNGSAAIVMNANRGITITANNGTLTASNNGTIPGKITGPGNLTVTGVSAAAIQLNNTGNDWAGTTTINSGIVRLGASGVLPDSTGVTFSTTAVSTLDVNGMTETIASLSGGASATIGQVILGNGTLTVGDANDTTYNGAVTNVAGTSGRFIKQGTGTITYNGVWTNTGGVIINEGGLKYSSNSAGLADTVLVTINANGTLDMGGNGTNLGAANDTVADIAGSGKITGLISSNGTTAGLRLGGAGTTTFSGVIEGAGPAQLRVQKTGGSLTLTGNSNTYAGGTTVSNGKLLVNNTSGSGTGSGAVTITGTATAAGTAGTVGGTGSISGQINVNSGGHLAAGNGGANATLTTTTVVAAAGSHIEGLLGAPGSSDVLRAPTLTADNLGAILTASATTSAVTGVYTVIDSDSVLTTKLANFYFNNATGYDANLQLSDGDTNIQVNVTGTTLQDKTWNINANGNWSATPGSDQTLNWLSPGQPNGPGTTARFGSIINAAHIVTISDTSKTVGTLVFDNASSYTIAATQPNRLIMNTYSGNAAINVVSGSHTISASIVLTAPTNISVASGSTLSLTATNANGSVANNGGMTKTGAGTLLIQNDWFGSGATNINQGELKFGTTAAGLSSTSLVTIASGATLNMTNGATVIADTFGDLAGDGSIIGNSAANGLTLAGGATTTFNGTISGSSKLTIAKSAGSISLTNGTSSYGGGTIINTGTLRVNNDPNLGGSATGFGSVTVNSTGTLGGTGRIAGPITVASGGILAPGNSIGTLTAAATLVLSGGSILNFELNTVSGNDVSDQVIISASGGLTISGGTLNLTNLGSMTAGTYTLLDYNGSPIGTQVNNLTLGTQPAGFTYQLVDNATNTSVDLQVVAPGVAGDYNGNGVVDGADYVVWRKNPAGFGGDPDGYSTWRAHFGNPPGSGAALGGSPAVPEPSTMALLSFGATALNSVVRRRRR